MTGRHFPDGRASRAVLIGTGRFTDPHLPDLPAVGANLSALRDVLTDPEHGLLAPEHCLAVADPADASAVGAALSWAAQEATDLLLVYYAGHGLQDDLGRLHLSLPQTDADPEQVPYSAVSIELIKNRVGGALADSRVLLLDCCFSGQAVSAMSEPTGLALGQTEVAGTYTLTSTTSTAPSHAPEGERHTAFTGALLDALGRPEPLTLDDIHLHVDRALHRRGLPRPRRRSVGTTGSLALVRGGAGAARAPGAASAGGAGPAGGERRPSGDRPWHSGNRSADPDGDAQAPVTGKAPTSAPTTAPATGTAKATATATAGHIIKVALTTLAALAALILAVQFFQSRIAGYWEDSERRPSDDQRGNATADGTGTSDQDENQDQGKDQGKDQEKPGPSDSGDPAAPKPAFKAVVEDRELALPAPSGSSSSGPGVDYDGPQVDTQDADYDNDELLISSVSERDGWEFTTTTGKSAGRSPEECLRAAQTNPLPSEIPGEQFTDHIEVGDLLCTRTTKGRLALLEITALTPNTSQYDDLPSATGKLTVWTEQK
ncbi:caspase family protein [Streptomyces luteolus]|uniref:Caspase family protein n=1 Tax=Streptomyces luteolus TaxID=3043615 RepID=A0ABT6T3N1_9ACTN|nr:caspase family protein [Streptomyces sp. B-S-A12]MDI3421659.1 caspase family protein [Streptomyces sp. B-S-A12]